MKIINIKLLIFVFAIFFIKYQNVSCLEKNKNDIINLDISKWKLIKFNKTGFKTTNWSNFEDTYTKIPFSIKIPENWTISGTVFDDNNKNKIAEFLLGPVILDSGQLNNDIESNITKLSSEDEEFNVKIISIEKYNLNDYKIIKRIESCPCSGDYTGIWYPNIYYIFYKNKAFVISFYEYELNSKQRKLFELIISTFRFE